MNDSDEDAAPRQPFDAVLLAIGALFVVSGAVSFLAAPAYANAFADIGPDPPLATRALLTFWRSPLLAFLPPVFFTLLMKTKRRAWVVAGVGAGASKRVGIGLR